MLRKGAQEFKATICSQSSIGRRESQLLVARARALSLNVLQRTTLIAIRQRTCDLVAVWSMICAPNPEQNTSHRLMPSITPA
jgi:hypothetical protein